VCIFRSWLYCTLPLITVGVCVDPAWVGQVYVGGVDGNVHVKPVSGVPMRVPFASSHPRSKLYEVC
jgi:hypothetical protein